MLPELLQVTQIFSSLPGIGGKSAIRIAFHLLKQDPEEIEQFACTLKNFCKNIDFCSQCSAIKSINAECSFCDTNFRDLATLCVVEEPSDVFLIENSGEFSGIYHVLMGVLSPLDGVGPEDIRLVELQKRIQENQHLSEIIVATNPTIEGNATANYIAEIASQIRPIKVSRIASGLAVGSYLDFADSQVISQSIQTRVLIT